MRSYSDLAFGLDEMRIELTNRVSFLTKEIRTFGGDPNMPPTPPVRDLYYRTFETQRILANVEQALVHARSYMYQFESGPS